MWAGDLFAPHLRLAEKLLNKSVICWVVFDVYSADNFFGRFCHKLPNKVIFDPFVNFLSFFNLYHL